MNGTNWPADGAWTMDRLLAAERSGSEGRRLKFVWFWGHTPPPSRQLGPWVFSQWADLGFDVDGMAYPTAEHFMMAEKARLFGDESRRAEILAAPSPGAAKAVGRAVAGFDEAVWAQHRFDIVVRGSVAKFSVSAALRDYLVGTGDRVLVESSPRDRIWGIGMGRENPAADRPSRWRGENLLGFALMAARARLRSGQGPPDHRPSACGEATGRHRPN